MKVFGFRNRTGDVVKEAATTTRLAYTDLWIANPTRRHKWAFKCTFAYNACETITVPLQHRKRLFQRTRKEIRLFRLDGMPDMRRKPP
jgi:hypothetical protein